ncbi:MAG TPA: tellurite resistance TerB family protein [Polyangiaceae bacterium]|nr:tellurite resistance TerB family protein [Polyangiaceae bacterium]
MARLPTARLIELRDEMSRRGQRRSLVFPTAKPDVVEVVAIVEEYGALTEAMFLVMAAQKRMLNAQRKLLRGALDILSSGRVRTAHMEAMLDASAKRLAEDGFERRCQRVIEALREDQVRAETTLVLATAIAAADGDVGPEEQALIDRFARELGVDPKRLSSVLDELTSAPDSAP